MARIKIKNKDISVNGKYIVTVSNSVFCIVFCSEPRLFFCLRLLYNLSKFEERNKIKSQVAISREA
jgi:hypothetical protein